MRHVAAGLLASFISRNNNVERLWAPGVLYSEAEAVDNRVALDLLEGCALPEAPACASVARSYAAFLRAALGRHGFTPDVLSSATVSLVFGLPSPPRQPGDASFGDSFDCRVTLVSRDGKTVSRQASAQCAPHGSPVFLRAMAMREAGSRLLRYVSERSRDCDGRWAIEVLREAYANDQALAFDLLGERATPPGQAGDAVARLYAGQLRQWLGEWMSELRGAELRLRFYAFERFPGAAVFAETRLVARDGQEVWFNGGADIVPPPPWEGAT